MSVNCPNDRDLENPDDQLQKLLEEKDSIEHFIHYALQGMCLNINYGEVEETVDFKDYGLTFISKFDDGTFQRGLEITLPSKEEIWLSFHNEGVQFNLLNSDEEELLDIGFNIGSHPDNSAFDLLPEMISLLKKIKKLLCSWKNEVGPQFKNSWGNLYPPGYSEKQQELLASDREKAKEVLKKMTESLGG